MQRYICIHGHFYQPPRENPWLEEIELQESAFPYHDWNERVTAGCYARNGASRILGERDQISEIINNYTTMSFNFGPTLLAWMEEKAPDVYESIIEADKESQKNFSGHGSALAQPYNHLIMPLANKRDKRTQAIWGIRDFEHRFGRSPEGMWLPETAVDLESLELLAELGISFTILAPHQAKQTRPIGGRSWRESGEERIDSKTAYVCRLPSGNKINLFFYDGPTSQAVAFEGLLTKGEEFANRLIGAFSQEAAEPQLVHIATDGETYGHHHHFGEMGLSYALHYIQANDLARITNYGEFLEKHPPTHEVKIHENTSWSCAHGIERWRADCGCNIGGNRGWTQAWRAPLRESLDWLRDALIPIYQEKASQLLKAPLEARDDYIEVILKRTTENIESFLRKHAQRPLTEEETTMALRLLELQRHALLMYTSCGWFFDELSGIETVQVMQYAGRAIQLATELSGDGLEPRFLELLEKAESNKPQLRDGRKIYEKFVIPAALDLFKVGAHYAISSLFEDYPEQVNIGCYLSDRKEYVTFETGKAKLALGKALFTSLITREADELCFGVLHFGDHNLNCGVHQFEGQEPYIDLVHEISEPFAKADFPEVIRHMDRHFGASTYSLRSLFKDEQRRVLDLILQSTLDETHALYSQIYENQAPLLRFIKDLGIPPPKALYANAEFVLNSNLRQALEEEELDLERIDSIHAEALSEGVSLDNDMLEYALRKTMERMAEQFSTSPESLALLKRLEAASGLLDSMPFAVNTWKVQNIYFEILMTLYPYVISRCEKGDKKAKEWVSLFTSLGEKLSIEVGTP
jgi:alpha-amylase/alpha-mannosidase (GH57 family)